MEIFTTTWPWYVAGPLIGLMVPMLLLMGNKQFGISGSIRDFVAVVLQRRDGALAYDKEKSSWRLWFSLGVVAGGALLCLIAPAPTAGIGETARATLQGMGLAPAQGLYPQEILGGSEGFTVPQLLCCIVGGLLVGFGTRWAGGCTSGHTIMGLSQLSVASLVATMAFFAGGLVTTFLIYPYLLPYLSSL